MQCLSLLKLRVPVYDEVYPKHFYEKYVSAIAIGRLFSLGKPATPTNKINNHNITEMLPKVELNTYINMHIDL